MDTALLEYDLPADLIAQHPADRRTDSRMLVLNRSAGSLADRRFAELPGYLRPGDCLVINDTRVIPARFYAARRSGAAIEGLFLREAAPGRWLVYLKGLRKLKIGEAFDLHDRQHRPVHTAQLLEIHTEGRCIIAVDTDLDAHILLADIGYPPLPPYIKRDADGEKAAADLLRYQTVYAAHPGAVAAPTAGLHFTTELLDQIAADGVRTARITLHVGPGTFKPVTEATLENHVIHTETFALDGENAEIINQTHRDGGRIIAVGTTSTRTLETLADDTGHLEPTAGETNLFITPGYRFKIIDALITNFHLPRSTLLALVAAFAGLEPILNAYKHAAAARYRFYSYGDSMLIL